MVAQQVLVLFVAGIGISNLLTALTDTQMAYVVIRMEIRERKTAHIFDFLEKVITKGIDVKIVKEEKEE